MGHSNWDIYHTATKEKFILIQYAQLITSYRLHEVGIKYQYLFFGSDGNEMQTSGY